MTDNTDNLVKIQRQNLLNNFSVVGQLKNELAEQETLFNGVYFQGESVYTKKQVAEIFAVDERTIDRYLSDHGSEFRGNGYQLLTGNNLNEFKELISAHDINVVSKITQLSVFL